MRVHGRSDGGAARRHIESSGVDASGVEIGPRRVHLAETQHVACGIECIPARGWTSRPTRAQARRGRGRSRRSCLSRVRSRLVQQRRVRDAHEFDARRTQQRRRMVRVHLVHSQSVPDLIRWVRRQRCQQRAGRHDDDWMELTKQACIESDPVAAEDVARSAESRAQSAEHERAREWTLELHHAALVSPQRAGVAL